MLNKNFVLKIVIGKILFFWSLIAIGQSPSIIPPTPEAASFSKSIDIPVSMYTGLPNVGIDFYTIKTKEMQIPIRINYNARGIQVAEIASRVGIGWSLSFGGIISRQVRGFADDAGNGILYHNYYNEVFTDSNARSSLMDDIVNNNADEFPDQFFFDINGESGKFIMDYNDGKVVLQKFSDLKMIPTFEDGRIVGWIVTDKLGNKYYYGKSKDGMRQADDYDVTDMNYSFGALSGMEQLGNDGDRPYTAWHLMEIETYLHEKIEFIYELEEGIRFQRSYDKADPKILPNHDRNPNPDVRSYFSKLNTYQNQIKEISFPGGKVVFDNDSIERKDFTNTYSLGKISVLDDQNSLIREFDFNYFYQRCLDDANQLYYLKQSDTCANYRLFLSQIQEKGLSSMSLPPYQFEYDSVKLPNRFSNSQDNWGYYNGKPNGEYLTFFTYGTLINRTVDTALSGAGLLKKITYPTGGSTSFIYEQNRVIPPAFIGDIYYNPNNPGDSEYVGEAFFRDSMYYADSMYSKVITIGSNKVGQVTFQFVLPMNTNPSTTHYQVILDRLDSTTTIYLYPPDTLRQLNIPPGQYKLEVIPTHSSDTLAFIASLQWTVFNPDPQLDSGEWYGAGKRIKRIEQKIGNNLASFKNYEYKATDGTSSGKMLGLPSFYYINKTYFGGYPTIDNFGSMPGSPLTQLQGNSVGYSRVTEYYGDSLTNQGKTVYQFSVDEDAGDYYKFPYHLPTDFEWLRGLPLRTEIYKNNGGSYELQKTIENTYLYAGVFDTSHIFTQPFLHQDSVYEYQKDRNIFYLPLFIFAPTYDPVTQFINTNVISFKVYYLTAGTVDLDSTVEKEYTNGIELLQTVKYGYNYPRHYLPIAQRTKTSKENSTVTTTYYPLDINSRTTAEQKLVDQNRIAVPVRVEDSVKNSSNTLLASTIKKTVYKDWGNDLVLPDSLQTAINGSALVTEFTYNKYDTTNGSPLEISTRSGIKETYLWGYDRQYPVAKVIASDYNTVSSFINQSMLDNAIQYSDQQIRTELNKIRTGLTGTNAQTLTYTYRPLIGLSSITNQNNQTNSYVYDGLGRLAWIKDKDNNIVKKYCYNYAGQSESCSIGCANTLASWQIIDSTCQLDSLGQNTGYKVIVLRDTNFCSASYSTTRDSVSVLNCAACHTPANWQTTGNYRCAKDSANHNTGYREREEKDMSTCSLTYNQTRWTNIGYDTTSCPLPIVCNSSNCIGEQYKCVNGSCEEGVKVFTDSYYDDGLGGNVCVYHYEWSDGSWSQNYTFFAGFFSCNVN